MGVGTKSEVPPEPLADGWDMEAWPCLSANGCGHQVRSPTW